jgi:DNA-binding NarL/FixJ family response regulator
MTFQTQSAKRPSQARLLIVDDHELARAGLRSMLAGERDLEVVGEAADGHQALAVCRRLRPDLVLMDVRLPDLDGLAATRAIKQELARTSVIIVTMHENPDYLLEAIKAGAAGYVLKGATRRELLATVRRVLGGESVLQPDVATQLLRRLAIEAQGPAAVPKGQLTPREHEVLRLVARGQTNQEIADALTLSVSTVKTHLEHIIAKLEVSDRTQAAVRAIELGLLSAGPSDGTGVSRARKPTLPGLPGG